MTNLSILNHPDLGTIRNVKIKGEPWFVAKDVCSILGLSKYRDAIAKLDDDEKQGCPLQLDTPGGQQSLSIINESGLYSLILQSRKPEAKAFKKWITSEVLPSIRKYGCYISPAQQKSSSERRAIERAYHEELQKYITSEDIYKVAKKMRKDEWHVNRVLCGVARDNDVMRVLQERALANKSTWEDAYTPERMDEVLTLLK